MSRFFEDKNTKKIQNEYKKYSFLFLFLASLSFVGFFVVPNAFAATGINKQISFQGKVVNTDGTNVTSGSYTFLFCIYTTPTPATACTSGADNDAVWRESKSITVTDGIFQTNLGDTTAFASLIDFNTDNIYLGINFNANGQMSPLVRFTATPYALNAAKVGGLTVTDTTGTLTIPNGKTISFADAFTTTGAFPLTLTSTASTTATLPAGTVTLVDLATSQSLTNKTIGSTGLVFSGATTDITTASGESLVIVAAGAGTIDLQDATTVDSLTTDTGGVTIASGQSYSGSGAVTLASASATALTLNSGTNGTINIGTDASAETINIGNTGAAAKTIAIGNNTQANTITIGDVSVTGLSLTDNNWSISTAGAAAFASLSSSGAIAANGGITFDASTDTVGAFTSAGTIDMSTNILTNIGNTGTDFVASTGALTLAGILTANGGISLPGSQSLAAAALSYVDLGLITHSSTANQGLRLPNAPSATPSNPTSGEGYLAWDATGNQLIAYNGSAWTTVGGAGVSADSLDFTEFQDQLDLDASTDILAPSGQAYVLSITNEGTGNSFRVNDANTDTTPFVIDASGNVGIGDSTPDALLDFDFTSTSGVGATEQGAFFTISDTGVVSSGSDDTYGTRTVVTRTGATGGNITAFGNHSQVTVDNAGGGNSVAYAFYGTADSADSNFGGFFSANGTSATGISSQAYPIAGNGTGLDLYVEQLSTTTANINTGINLLVSDGWDIASGTDITYGINASVGRTGATTGTINTYGINLSVSGDTGGASTATGLAVAVSGADTNYSGLFTGGNFGIGDTTPSSLFSVGATSQFQVNSTGAIAAATGITSSGTIIFSGLSTAGIVTNTAGGVLGTTISVPVANGGTNATTIGSAGSIAYSTGTAYAFSAVGTAGQALVSGGTGVPTFFAPTAGSILFAGTSGILEQDNANFFFDNASNELGLGTASPSAQLDIFGTTNALRLSYDVSNYASLSSLSDGTLSLTSSNVSESQFVIGTGSATDDSVAFDGSAQDYYAGLDHTTGYFTIGTGFTVGTSTLFALDSTGNVGIGTGVTAPGARLDLASSSTNVTANTTYGQRNTIADSGVVSSGTDTTYGNYLSLSRTGATGGTVDTFGQYTLLSTDNAGAGTSTAYGVLINTGTSGATNADTVYGMRIETEANAATTTYGLYVDAGTQAGTEYAAAFLNGNVGIGDATPDALLDLDFVQTSGALIGIAAPSAVTLAGDLTGQNINLSTNVTATNQSVTGQTITLPSATNTGGGAYLHNGLTISSGTLTQNTGAGVSVFTGASITTPNIVQTTGLVSVAGLQVTTGSITTGGTQMGVNIVPNAGAAAGTLYGIRMASFTGGAGTETALEIGTGWDTFLNTASIDISGAGAITGATGVSTTTVTASSAIAANGGITFDASTDTVGAFTATGTIDMSTNILTNIGNTGTDFVVTTGALNLAGVLTANGGISLAGSQSFTASALSYMDLGSITHGSTAVQGLRLPQAASATPSNPTSGEGYLAWDTAGNQLITYNGSAWTTLSGGGGYNLIKDETTSLTVRTTLAFLGAGVSCADNASQTECTISGGAGSDLQGTYDTDADGGNVTISLTAADDGLVFTNPTSGGNNLSTFLLQLDQANTTANMLALDIVQASNASNGVNLTGNAIDGETGLAITTNGLTSGKGISITSSSTTFTGNLADVSLTGSDVANTGNVLAVSNTGTANANTALFVDHRATGTGNLALRVNDESSDTTPFIIDGEGRVGIGTTAISPNAATERLLQVGSETNRGNMAAYGEVVSVGLDRHTALSGITDVYVYDTTGDSDGGRWVDWATTDNLSWYTEALDDGASDPCVISSDDRCYKKSFPRKAILVVTTSALYIFDAATNDMWMKFSQNASGYALGVDTNNDPSSVTALNGVIYVGLRGTATTSLYAIDFVNDRMWNYDGTDRSGADTGISGRNAAVTYNVDNDTKLDLAVTGTAANWQNVNDVYAAVITNSISAAAIGGTTNTTPGNGKVFIALATDAGVTVINLTAGTLNQYSDVADDDYTAVVISRRGYLYALNTTQDQLERWDTMDTDKASEVAGTYTRKWDETVGTGPALASTAFNIVFPGPDNLEIAERASLTLDSEDIIYVGHSLGLAELHDHTTQVFGWVKYFNATRQTPMMPVAGINDMVLPMDDSSGTQAQDLAIANTDMAIKGTPTLGVNGVAGKAINFDNTDDYLCSDANQDNTCDVDTAFNMSTVGWTFSIWFKHSTTAPATAADTIFEKCVTATPGKATGCVIAYMTTTGAIVVANDTDATWTRPDEGAASYNITATSTYTYNDNQWHHLVISRTNANDVDSWIDGNGMNLSNATGGTTTFDGSQIVSIGASCVLTVTANCGAGINFWDGQLDDAQFIVGTTTQATLSALQVRRLYNVERPRVSKKTITVTDATSATSTSITDTGESWYVNEFAGLIVEITGSDDADCIGITRRITGNTATALTFTPAVPGACTLDTSADFQVDSEKLYGASSSIAGIGITAESPLGEARQMCVGTNSGSDTGGVTCYNHQAGPSIVADVYHSQASQTDDTGTDWTGSNYDEMVAIDLSTRTLLMASEAHLTSITETVRLGQGLDYLANQLYMIRTEIIQDGITAVGSTAPEVGFTGGADLAENYYSDVPLEAGTVVALNRSRSVYVDPTQSGYQRDMLGVVATDPGIVLGDPSTNGYPIALVGRVPVKVTNENGQIYAGDRLTSASRSGFAMRAVQSGRVLGEALADAVDWTVCEGEDPNEVNALLCTTVLVFVNLTDYSGQSVELAMAERDAAVGADGLSGSSAVDGALQGLGSDTGSIRLATSAPTKQEQILSFLKELHAKQLAASQSSSEVFTGRVSASTEVITPTLYVDQIFAKSIKADSIEGLSIWTNQIASLEQKYAGLEANTPENPLTGDATSTAEKTLLNLEKFTVGTFTASLDALILGKLSLAGGMTVGGDAQFASDTVFAKLASFFGKTLFKDTVSFEKSPLFGHDTAGFAVIEKGARKVRVVFDVPYEKQPIVTVALTNDASPLLPDADESLKRDIEVLEEEYLESVFDEDIRSVVTEKSTKGFTIVLSEKAPRDLQFSWVALSVDQAKSFNSEKEKAEEKEVIPEPIPTPLPVEGTLPLQDTPIVQSAEGVPTVPVEEVTPSQDVTIP